jgi:Asp-tRNA(Asn)/Glu-tRNA(Gln) amidotransferase A subunit family amidase
LREHLLKQTFTSVDLVNVFGKRCYTIGRALNLTAEENFEEALIEAEIKDKERLEAIKNGTTNQLPLFHGIPISIKDIVK